MKKIGIIRRLESGEYRWYSDKRMLIRDECGQAMSLVGN